jgi:uncharacterized protein (TIGR02246 family)
VADPTADELEIRNLIARIALAADGPDVEAYVALFTPDARWEMPGAPRRGRADIREGSLARRAAGQIGPGSATRHVVSTLAVMVHGDRALASSYWQFFTQTTTEPHLALMGAYHDELVRTEDGWLLSRRQITIG